MKKCIICECDIETDKHDIVYDATIWSTTGNYGSTIYDPMEEGTKLEAYICDRCLIRKKSLLEEVKFHRQFCILSRKEPNFDVQDNN